MALRKKPPEAMGFFIKISLTGLLLTSVFHDAGAAEIYLKNGDRITGEIIEKNDEDVIVDSEAAGRISVKRGFVERIIDAPQKTLIAEEPETAEDAVWDNSLTAGYTINRGNTEDQQFTASVHLHRNRMHVDEITLKGDLYYSSVDKETEAERWDGLGRYAWSFGPSKLWYNFYKLEAARDRFSQINYRLLPAAGVGCWFFDEPEMKLLAEAALGVEYTDYRDESESRAEMVLLPRGYLEKSIFVNSKLTQDVIVYPSLSDSGEYRLRSETTLTNPLNDKLAVNFSFVDEYNSDPPEDTKSNDMRFISSLSYSF